MMYGRGKSDSAIVAAKLVNKAGRLAAESVERRAGAKGSTEGIAKQSVGAMPLCLAHLLKVIRSKLFHAQTHRCLI